MGPAFPSVRRPWLRGCALCLASLTLAAQGLPPLPALPPVANLPQVASLGELVPLRPMAMSLNKDGPVPLRLRGKNIQETAEGWTLEDGVVESPDLLLLADHIRYQALTGEMQAEGHIRLEGPSIRLRCERLRMNWTKRAGEAWAVELELPPSWVLRSDKVAFNTMRVWDFEQVELSPCPQDKPGWKAMVSKLTVDLDNYATIRNLWIWVGSIPTYYYIPWAMYPARAERTSGLLPIGMAFSGPMGASLTAPYYQVLGPSSDATLSPTLYSQQGVLWGGELRWDPEPTHRGSVQGEYIHQDQDGLDRYRFNVKELWQREDGWQFSADLNGASDTLLDADYGQGIGRLGATSFDSAVFLGKSFPWASLNLTANQQKTFFLPGDAPYYYPDVITSLQRRILPSLQGRIFPVPVGNFYFDGGLQVSRLGYDLDLGGVEPVSTHWTPPGTTSGAITGANYTWGREDAFVRMQGRLGQWGPFRADLQTEVRTTHYSATLPTDVFILDNFETTALGLNPFTVNGPDATRTLGSARLLLSAPPVGRSYQDVSLFGYTGEIKHLVNPYFAFTETSQSGTEGRLPHFDEVDDNPGVNNSATGEQSLQLGMKQHFLGRGAAGTPFTDLVRWGVSATYHFRPILLSDGQFKQGWATIDNDIDVEPNDKLRISFRRSSDVTDSSADDSLSAELKTGDGSRLSLAYFSTSVDPFLVRQKGIQMSGLQRVWDDRLRLEFLCSYDFPSHGFSSSQVGLAYVTPCVSTSLRFSHVNLQGVVGALTPEDRLDLVMTLRGLGDLITFGL